MLHGLFGIEPFTFGMTVLFTVLAIGVTGLFHVLFGIFGAWHAKRLATWCEKRLLAFRSSCGAGASRAAGGRRVLSRTAPRLWRMRSFAMIALRRPASRLASPWIGGSMNGNVSKVIAATAASGVRSAASGIGGRGGGGESARSRNRCVRRELRRFRARGRDRPADLFPVITQAYLPETHDPEAPQSLAARKGNTPLATFAGACGRSRLRRAAQEARTPRCPPSPLGTNWLASAFSASVAS
ncbi:MAG: hypothetical protein ACLSVD_07850 [Eggerthellaceae bacterium]